MTLGIVALAKSLRLSRISCTDLIMDSIAQIDLQNTKLKAWTHLDREASILAAGKLDTLASRGIWLGPLHGIPVGVKDIIDVAGMPTGAGFHNSSGTIAREDSEFVADLRAQGMVIVGKTTTCAFAGFDQSPAVNPIYPDRTPGGSSAGSAVAVASGHCPVTLGSQTGGSILRPAAYCSVVGFKPTWGVIPVKGILPLAPSLDHAGFLVNHVSDLPSLLNATLRKSITGKPPRTFSSPRFVFWEGLDKIWGSDLRAIPETIRLISPHGAIFRSEPIPYELEGWLDSHHKIMASEAYFWHNRFMPNWETIYPEKIKMLLQMGRQLRGGQVIAAFKHRQSARTLMNKKIDHDEILCLPASETEVPLRSMTGNSRIQSLASFLGWPALSFALESKQQIDKKTGQKVPQVQWVAKSGQDWLLVLQGIWAVARSLV